MRIHWEHNEKVALLAEFKRLRARRPGATFESLIKEAMLILPLERRRPYGTGMIRFFSDTTPAVPETAHKRGPYKRRKKGSRLEITPGGGRPFRGVRARSKVTEALSLDDAITALADAIVLRVIADMKPKLATAISAPIAAAAIRIAPTVKPGTDLHDLDSTVLRIELMKARAQNDIGRAAKCLAVLKRRDQAANTVETSSKEDEEL